MSVNTKEAISLYKQVIVEHPILSPTEDWSRRIHGSGKQSDW